MKNWFVKINTFFALFLLVAVFGTIFPAKIIKAATGVPRILNYQGRLYNASGTLLGGTGTAYCFRFGIFDDSPVGAPDNKLWPAATSSGMSVTVSQGVFNVGVGDTGAGGDALTYDFESNDTTYLNVEVASKVGGACDNDETYENLSPRQRITATAYAINSLTLRGFTASQNATGTQIPVLSSGNLVLGGTNPQINATGTNTLTLQGGTGTANIQFFSSSNFITNTGTLNIAGILQSANINQFLRTTSSPTFTNLTLTSYPTGTILFSRGSGGVLGSSTTLFWDNGTSRLGVGTSSPTATLHVQGDSFFFATSTFVRSIALGTTTANGLFYIATTTSILKIENDGRIGFGTASPLDPISISISRPVTSTRALLNLTNTALQNGHASGTYIGANPASFNNGNFFDFQVNGVSKAKLNATGTLTVASCEGCEKNWLTSSTFVYLATTTNDIVLGGTSANNGTIFMDTSDGLIESNGLLRRQHGFREDFSKDRADVTANSLVWGDTQAINFSEVGAITLIIRNDVANGISACTAVAAGDGCIFSLAGPTVVTDVNYIYVATNKPQGLFQVKPGFVGANNKLFVGFSDQVATTTEPTNGAYFTNDSSTNWVAVMRSGANRATSSCGGAISTSSFALLKVAIQSPTSTLFSIDPNITDGISWTNCSVALPAGSLTTSTSFTLSYSISTGGTAADFDIDFIDVAQDDPVVSTPNNGPTTSSAPLNLENTADLAEAYPVLDTRNLPIPGALVSLAEEGGGKIRASNSSYEKNLFGVVSKSPHTVMGEEKDGEETVRVALLGRVPVRVNLDNGPIKAGDWLTSSNHIGEAMRADSSGMVIGRALENYDGNGENSILAFIHPEERGGNSLTAITNLNNSIQDALADLSSIASNIGESFKQLVLDKIIARLAVIGEIWTKKVSLLPDADLVLPNGANQITGQGMIPAGSTSIEIHNSKITSDSKIIVTPNTTLAYPLAVSSKSSGKFKVSISSSVEQPIYFDWFLIQTYSVDSGAEEVNLPEPPPPTNTPSLPEEGMSSVESNSNSPPPPSSTPQTVTQPELPLETNSEPTT